LFRLVSQKDTVRNNWAALWVIKRADVQAGPDSSCGDTAYYADPHKVESIAEGLYKVLTDASLRQSLMEKGLERTRLFSWEKSAKEHIKVFEEVLNS